MPISFQEPLNADLFDRIALEHARRVGLRDDGKPKNENKPTQLRRFYDELLLWEERVAQAPERFDECLPFIRMINAKTAYAQGRKLVDATFADLMRETLAAVSDARSLAHCKTFWEAFMGFYKLVRTD